MVFLCFHVCFLKAIALLGVPRTHALIMDSGVVDCVLECMCEDFKHFEEHAASRRAKKHPPSESEPSAGKVRRDPGDDCVAELDGSVGSLLASDVDSFKPINCRPLVFLWCF